MMWTRRDGVALFRTGRPSGPRFSPAAVVSLAATSVASVLEAQQFVVVAILQVMLVAIIGLAGLPALLAAFLYLFFLVPSGAEFVPALQQVTAHFAVIALKLIGVPVFSNGAVIEVPAGTFAVAEACAGLRFLVATIAFGVFYAAQIYRGITSLVFIGLCIVVPIIANGMRVFGSLGGAIAGKPHRGRCRSSHLWLGLLFAGSGPGFRGPPVRRFRGRCFQPSLSGGCLSRFGLVRFGCGRVVCRAGRGVSGLVLAREKDRKTPCQIVRRPFRRPGGRSRMTAGGSQS